MAYLMLAVIDDGYGHDIGFRLMDTKTTSIVDTSIASVTQVLKSGKAEISNLEIKSNQLVGSNGALSRYTRINRDGTQVSEKSPLIVISRIGNSLRVANHQGKVKVVSEQSAIQYSHTQGVANGKVTSRHGKEVLSSIVGYYPEEVARPTPAPPKPTPEPSRAEPPQPRPEPPRVATQVPNNETLPIEVINAIQYYLTRVLKTDGSLDHPDAEYILSVRRENRLATSVEPYRGLLALLGFMGEQPLPSISNLEEFKATKKLIEADLTLPENLVNLLWGAIRSRLGLQFYCGLFNCYSGNITALFKSKHRQDLQLQIVFFRTLETDEPPKLVELMNMRYCLDYYFRIKAASEIADSIIEQAGFEVVSSDNKISQLFAHSNKLDQSLFDILLTILAYTAEYEDISNLNPENQTLINHVIDTKTIVSKLALLNSGFDRGIPSMMKEFIGVCSGDQITFSIGSDEAETKTGADQTVQEPDQVKTELSQEEKDKEALNKLVADSAKRDKIKYLDSLLTKAQFSEIEYSKPPLNIAKDIISKKIPYNKLSQKQLFRINQAIKMCEQRLGIGEPTKVESKPAEKTENKSHTIDEIPGLREKINRIESFADKPEMQVVLDETPIVLNICLLVERTGKVSDRQLKHINKAIEILDKQ